MSPIFGTGELRYRVEAPWGELPSGWQLRDVAAVGVDGDDNVYAFHRGEHPVIVFDRRGNFLRSWGEGMFTRPHGMHITPEGCLWLTDDGAHTVRKFDLHGRELMTIGTPGVPSAYMSGDPFCRCTHTAVAPDQSIYVADGYGNARIHKYDARGRHLFSWGKSGTGPGELNLPHNIVCDEDGVVHVADRENHRVQRFDGEGRYLGQWNNLHRPCAMCRARIGNRTLFVLGELGPSSKVNVDAPNLGPRVTLLDTDGQLVGRVGVLPAGIGDDRFVAPHGIAVDSRGDIYVSEVAYTYWPTLRGPLPAGQQLCTLRKLVRISD